MDRYEALKETLSRTCPDMILREQEPMWRHTTFEIGGPVRMMAGPADERELQMTLRAAHQHDIVPFILGTGSNLLCQDEPIDRFVVKTTGALTKLAVLPGDVVLCGAGVAMPQLAAFAMQNGLTGLEFLSGIPGIGKLFVLSLNYKDYDILFVDMAIFTTISLLAGVVLDLSYGFIDPRIRMGAKK